MARPEPEFHFPSGPVLSYRRESIRWKNFLEHIPYTDSFFCRHVYTSHRSSDFVTFCEKSFVLCGKSKVTCQRKAAETTKCFSFSVGSLPQFSHSQSSVCVSLEP